MFSWDHCNSQDKLETMLMRNLGGTNKEYYGIFRGGLLHFLRSLTARIIAHLISHPQVNIWNISYITSQRSNLLPSDSSYLDKQSGYHWDMIFFPIAHSSPHSFHCCLAPSLLWRLEVPVFQSCQQVLGLLACLLLLKVKWLAQSGKVLLFWWGNAAKKWFSDFGLT